MGGIQRDVYIERESAGGRENREKDRDRDREREWKSGGIRRHREREREIGGESSEEIERQRE